MAQIFLTNIAFIVRQDLGRETGEVFYRKVKLFQGDPPPSFVSKLEDAIEQRLYLTDDDDLLTTKL